VEGKYILRCIGRGDKAKPIAYADRDFYLVKSDLATGTASKGKYGSLTFKTYNKTDAPKPGDRYNVDVDIAFLPDASVSCTDVSFIQATQAVDPRGASDQKSQNVAVAERQTEMAWSVDQSKNARSPYYIMRNDPKDKTKTVDNPAMGKKGSGGATPSE